MKLLHTSDWHLGRTLYHKKERYDEHTAFFNWLLETIKENSVELLIVAGDIFDNASPNSTSQKMYYDFLLNVRKSGCQNVVVVGGNHDSPSFLNAPKEVLALLNVFVVGKTSEDIDNEVIVIKDSQKNPIAIVCAVPFLRERDISKFVEGETYKERAKRIADNIKKHYENVAKIADNKRKNINKNIPIIATGHLAVLGGKKTEDDGVKDLYIGNIECSNKDIFPQLFDYVALGHFHIPSVIDKKVCYSGSPIPMGFGEANQTKSVFLVEFEECSPTINKLELPVFQQLFSIQGDKSKIATQVAELKKMNKSVWVEIIYDGNDIFPNFTDWANEITQFSKIEIIKLQNKQYWNELLSKEEYTQSLDQLDKFDVFEKLLEKNRVPDKQKEELNILYREIVNEVN